MRPMRRLLTALAAVMLIVVPASIAQGAQGGGKPDNPGGGGNSGGNSGKANNPKGNLYSDLWVVLRDARGVPVLDANQCLQPISFDAGLGLTPLTLTNTHYPYEGDVYLLPLIGTNDDELEPCDVDPNYVNDVMEVDLGRLNLGRSPEKVLARQLDEVVSFLSGGTASLDASGRLVVNDVALDSPLANLTAYQSILETGMIGPLAVPNVDLTDLQLTAAMLAAGSPKESFEITVDTVQYLNRILSIPTDVDGGILGTLPLGATEEVFLDYTGFGYDRSEVFQGCATRYALNSDGDYVLQEPDTLINLVFGGDADKARTGIDAYAHLAEDARQVLVWVHDLGSLLDAVDPITVSSCAAG